MSTKTLKQALRRFAFKDRLSSSLVPVSMVGVIVGALSLQYSVPEEVGLFVVFWFVWLMMPRSYTAVARRLNRRFGDDPDFLCAIENERVNSAPMEALRLRSIAELRSHNGSVTLGKKWFALVAMFGWSLPLLGTLGSTGAVSRNEKIKPDELSPVEVIRASAQDEKNKRRLLEKREPESHEVTRFNSVEGSDSKGKAATMTGTKRRSVVTKSEAVGNARPNSLISEYEQSDSKLTAKRIKGTVRMLKQDRLDPSEKYPVEYHEAIREWFLRRSK